MIVFLILGWIWIITWFIILLQAWFMSGNILFLPAAFLVSYGWYRVGRVWYRYLKKKNRIALLFLYMFVALHFIPLILQLLGVISPRWETIFLAVIGMLLYSSAK